MYKRQEFTYTKRGSPTPGKTFTFRADPVSYTHLDVYKRQMLFLGAYGILLSSVSGKREIMIGTPAAGRNHRELQEICGPFINTMPLCIAVDKETEPRCV